MKFLIIIFLVFRQFVLEVIYYEFHKFEYVDGFCNNLDHLVGYSRRNVSWNAYEDKYVKIGECMKGIVGQKNYCVVKNGTEHYSRIQMYSDANCQTPAGNPIDQKIGDTCTPCSTYVEGMSFCFATVPSLVQQNFTHTEQYMSTDNSCTEKVADSYSKSGPCITDEDTSSRRSWCGDNKDIVFKTYPTKDCKDSNGGRIYAIGACTYDSSVYKLDTKGISCGFSTYEGDVANIVSTIAYTVLILSIFTMF